MHKDKKKNSIQSECEFLGSFIYTDLAKDAVQVRMYGKMQKTAAQSSILKSRLSAMILKNGIKQTSQSYSSFNI